MEEGNSRFLESVLAEVLAHLEPPKDGRIRHDLSPASLRKTTDLDLPLVGAGLDRVLDDIRTYLSQAVRTDQPGFMNPLWGGLTPEGLAGELVTAATNTSMYTYEIAPLASLIETAVLDRMRQHLRMPTGAGTLTTGGSNGNLMGVLCARQAALPASGHDAQGLPGGAPRRAARQRRRARGRQLRASRVNYPSAEAAAAMIRVWCNPRRLRSLNTFENSRRIAARR